MIDMRTTRLPLNLPLSAELDETDVVRVFHLAHALTNGEQHAQRLHARVKVSVAELLPPDGEVLASSRGDRSEHVAIAYPGCSLVVSSWHHAVQALVTAQTSSRL
ncbi:hypothetical protein B7486_72805, partial [cyanobacterium TDX16]